MDDAELAVEIRQQVSELLTYGYFRVWGLLRRAREAQLLPAINVKLVYRDSDGFEFHCEDGAKLSVTFALGCCDREAFGWVASPTGYNCDDIRDLMLEG
ncbi:hypothetical protein HCU66_12540 [Pseudomonas frederiksbergensis]|nr:hypothetical protein [Pseudomonas frederiksbergensis]